eukprot:1161053-Pelagomonas_calceolata.AAC.13
MVLHRCWRHLSPLCPLSPWRHTSLCLCASPTRLDQRRSLPLVCPTQVLETLEPLMPPQRMEAYTPLLVRLLNKIVKEMTTAAQVRARVHARVRMFAVKC